MIFATTRLGAALLAVALLTGILTAPAAADPCTASTPCFVVIWSDDQGPDQFAYMPFLQSAKATARVFENYYFTESRCCPSRASMLLGQYPHNHQVLFNQNGYGTFMAQEHWKRHWARKLHTEGWLTAFIGKMLNGYSVTDPPMDGWSFWWASHGSGDYDYDINQNGEIKYYGTDPNQYYTKVASRKARRTINDAVNAGSPFAIFLSLSCPHKPHVPAYEYQGAFAAEPFGLLNNPSFDEVDVSDKPSFIQALPRLTQGQIAKLTSDWREQLECLQSVDDELERIFNKISNVGQSDNTLIIFGTDNGDMAGQHRIAGGKAVAYMPAIRSKLFVWGPGVTPGESDRIVLNQDIAPTIRGMAGFGDTYWYDGRSIEPLLGGDAPWRSGALIQNPANPGRCNDKGPASFCYLAYVTGNYIYTAYNNGEREFYDLAADPYQLVNGHVQLPMAFKQDVEARILALYACAHDLCRAAEDALAPVP